MSIPNYWNLWFNMENSLEKEVDHAVKCSHALTKHKRWKKNQTYLFAVI